MTRMMLTGIGTVIVLALASAILMVANAPARTDHGDPYDTTVAQSGDTNSVGRLVLTFEPSGIAIDRD